MAEHEEDERDDDGESEDDAGGEMTPLYTLHKLAAVVEALGVVDPEEAIRSAISVGDSDGGLLLLLGLTGRLDRVADVSHAIDEDAPWVRSDLLQALALDAKTSWFEGSVFDATVRAKATGAGRYDLCYLHKTLHHLRENNCRFREDADTSEVGCSGEEHVCVGVFNPGYVFDALLAYAPRVLVSEYFYVGEDGDQDTSQGGILDLAEIKELIVAVAAKHDIQFLQPVCRRVGRGMTAAKYDKELDADIRHNNQLVFVVEERGKRRARRRR